jgi:hypothetical protein
VTPEELQKKQAKALRVAAMSRRDGYYHVNGEKYPSVTTILQVLNKPALVSWAAKTAAGLVLEDPEKYSTAEAAASGIYSARDSAGSRGTTVHSIAESYTHGRPLKVEQVAPSLQGFARAVRGFWEITQPKPVLCEACLVSTIHRYAGRTDLIAEMGGEMVIVDFKTGKGVYAEAALQLSAYRAADKVWADGQLTDAPATSAAFVVLLGSDGAWSLHKQPEIPIEVFVAAKRLWEWQKGVAA